MLNYRWCTSGTLKQIGEDLASHRFDAWVFPIISQGQGWYRWAGGTYLMVGIGENNWQLYYWDKDDPRPFLRTVVTLEGFDG